MYLNESLRIVYFVTYLKQASIENTEKYYRMFRSYTYTYQRGTPIILKLRV